MAPWLIHVLDGDMDPDQHYSKINSLNSDPKTGRKVLVGKILQNLAAKIFKRQYVICINQGCGSGSARIRQKNLHPH